MIGYVKVHRSIENWEWYTDTNTFRIFFHLLIKANYKSNKWRGMTIPAGSLITSNAKLAEQTGLSVQQVRTALKKLISTQEVTSEATNGFTVVTLTQWAKYQSEDDEATSEATNEQQTDNKRITNEQQTDNNTIRREEIKKERIDVNDDLDYYCEEVLQLLEFLPTDILSMDRPEDELRKVLIQASKNTGMYLRVDENA